jgi:hypothetical protein
MERESLAHPELRPAKYVEQYGPDVSVAIPSLEIIKRMSADELQALRGRILK